MIQDMSKENEKILSIIRGFHNENNWNQIERLIKSLEYYDKYIYTLEIDNLLLVNKLQEQIRMMLVLKEWLNNSTITKRGSIINFIEVCLQKIK